MGKYKSEITLVLTIFAVIVGSAVLDNIGPGYGGSSLADKIKNPAT
jgi:hypothetical protein